MSIYLTKLLSLLIYPLSWVILLLLAGLVLLWRNHQRSARRLLLSGLLGLWIMATPLTGQWLMQQLEQTFAAHPAQEMTQADAIVLLGGGIRGSAPPRRPHPDLLEQADRVIYAAQLWQAGKAPKIIASGGTLSWQGHQQSEAQAMQALLEQLQVPASVVIEEADSQTTRQNAQNTLPLLRQLGAQRVLLVTSAAHMPRALDTFTRMMPDIIFIPAPTDVRILAVGDDLLDWLPQASGIGLFSEAWHEWVGRLVYRVRE